MIYNARSNLSLHRLALAFAFAFAFASKTTYVKHIYKSDLSMIEVSIEGNQISPTLSHILFL